MNETGRMLWSDALKHMHDEETRRRRDRNRYRMQVILFWTVMLFSVAGIATVLTYAAREWLK